MSDTKFTPAPWAVNPVGPHWNNTEIAQYEITYSDAGECIVDHVYKLADANLIAAAPEMYEMLARCARELAKNGYETEAVHELLAKARGE